MFLKTGMMHVFLFLFFTCKCNLVRQNTFLVRQSDGAIHNGGKKITILQKKIFCLFFDFYIRFFFLKLQNGGFFTFFEMLQFFSLFIYVHFFFAFFRLFRVEKLNLKLNQILVCLNLALLV
jgi:hypothetical protein